MFAGTSGKFCLFILNVYSSFKASDFLGHPYFFFELSLDLTSNDSSYFLMI